MAQAKSGLKGFQSISPCRFEGNSGECMLNKRFQYIPAMLLCLVTAGVYARSAFFPFHLLDDAVYVTQNVHIMQALSLDTVKWAFTSVYQYNWIPLTWLSFALDAGFFGTYPMGYHIVNIVLHVINVWLLFYLLKSVTGAFWRSLLVAALFALHPLRVESVVWIAERKDVLSTFFWMLTLIFYCLYAKKKDVSMYILALFSFTLGLLSKQMLVTVPAVLLLMDFWPLKRLGIVTSPLATDENNIASEQTTLKKLLIEKIPFLLLSAAATAIVFYANYVSKSLKSTELIPAGERLVNALWNYIAYLYKMFVPINLAIVYPTIREPYWKAVCAAILIGLVSYAAYKMRHSAPYLASGFLFYLITLFPLIGLIQVGTVSMADRFVYVPLIGIFIIISWGAGDIVARWPSFRHSVVAVTGFALAGCVVMTWVQLSYWKDNTTLFRHAVDVTKENHVAHETLGLAYANEGKSQQALAEFNKALNIGPDCPELHVCIGNLFDKNGQLGEAARQYEIVTRLNPGRAAGHVLYGRTLQKMGKIREAISEYELAISMEPQNAQLYDSLGLAHLQQGQFDEAIRHFAMALKLDPSLRQTSSNLEFALRLKRR